jgi:hypothetical protein
MARAAQRYLQAGYERLLRYQDASGGFAEGSVDRPFFQVELASIHQILQQ